MKKTKLFAFLGTGVLAMAAVVGTALSLENEVTPVHAAGETRTIYFNAGGTGLWDQAGAWFCAWTWGGTTGDSWVTFVDNDGDGYYEGDLAADRTGMKFLRMAPGATSPNWTSGDNGYWNQTGDITLNATNNCYTMTSWNSGVWSTYTPPTTPVIRDFYLIGTFNDWALEDADYKFTYDDVNDQYTLETTLTNGAAFKVNDGTWSWSIGNGSFTAVTSDVVLGSTTDGNVVMNTNGTHEYLFTMPGNIFGQKNGVTIALNEDGHEVVANFVNTYMHMDDVSTDNLTDTGACKGEDGYYALAKAAYQNLLPSQKTLFTTDTTYAAAWARFQAWASANGDTIDPNTLQVKTLLTTLNISNNSNLFVVIAIASVIVALAGVVVIKKTRKQD